MTFAILFVSIVILACLVGNRISNCIGVPMLLIFNASDSGPRNVSSLPASGAALTANTIYNVSSPVGTYVFAPPASGWAHGKFTTGGSVSVSFSGTFIGAAPAIEANKSNCNELPFYFKGKHYCFTILEVSKSIKSMYDDRIEKDMDAVQDMMSYLNL